MLFKRALELLRAILDEDRLEELGQEFRTHPDDAAIDIFAYIFPEMDAFAKQADKIQEIADLLDDVRCQAGAGTPDLTNPRG